MEAGETRKAGESRDPFIPLDPEDSAPKLQRSFRDFFPYELSDDEKRARVGFECSDRFGYRSYTARFDVEVRMIRDRWVPVECRRLPDNRWADLARVRVIRTE